MISNVDSNGNVQWTCLGLAKTCQQVNTYHVSHEQMQWLNEQEIAMPPCPKCGARMTIRIHTDEELTPPIITRDEETGAILQVAPNPHPLYSHNLWPVEIDIIRKQEPHPTMTHLTPAQIQEWQTSIRSKAPNAPVEWMLTETTRAVIHSVTQHPAVAVHKQLGEMMKQHGKEYAPPDEHVTAPRIPAIQVSQLSPPNDDE